MRVADELYGNAQSEPQEHVKTLLTMQLLARVEGWPMPPNWGKAAGRLAAVTEGETPEFNEEAFVAGEEYDFTDEEPQPFVFYRQPIPHEERTRRGILTGLTITFVAVLLLQLGFALFLSDDTWARVGPILSTASTLVATGFGFGWGYYFSRKG